MNFRLPLQGTAGQRKTNFLDKAAAGHWWGLFEDTDLAAAAGLNAVFGPVGQVGGVFTRAESRRKGFSRSAMAALIQDARDCLGLEKLILFTGERNFAARCLYESLGFTIIGYFGLFFGSWLE